MIGWAARGEHSPLAHVRGIGMEEFEFIINGVKFKDPIELFWNIPATAASWPEA